MKDENIKPIKTGGVKPAPPQLTEEPLKSDCTGEILYEREAKKKLLRDLELEIQQEYNNAGFFKRLWWRLKGLFS